MKENKHPYEIKIDEINHNLNLLIKRSVIDDAELTLLDNSDIMRLFKISPKTASNWRADGILKYFKIKGKQYYKLKDVKELIDTYTNGLKKK